MATNTTSTTVGSQPVVSDVMPYNKLLLDDKRPIGSGAFFVVYKAVHKDWGCVVAYKKLGIQFITDQRYIKDLKNEADIHRQLRHPNIVSMLSVVLEENNYGLVLEYVSYGSLDKFLQQIKAKTGVPFQMCWRLKARMSYEVCCGMFYLHTLDPIPVIHGDLKQQNLLVTDRLQIKLFHDNSPIYTQWDHRKILSFNPSITSTMALYLTFQISDFGLSKWKDYSRTHTHAGILQGTPSHIPPEHWMHVELSKNEKFDVYSYGILLWEIFTEERAFEKRNDMIQQLVINGTRPCLDKLPTNVPSQITDTISACWQQEPQKRPTFTELLSTIKDLIQGADPQSKIEQAVTDVLNVYNMTQSEHGRKMERVSQKLCDVMRRTDQILAYLLKMRALTSQEYNDIRFQSTYNVPKCLIDVLGSKPATSYQSFLEALKVSNQQHLYDLLELGVELNTDHREVLMDNYPYLKANLNVSETRLLDHLLQCYVLDEQEMREIQSKNTSDERAEQLLYIALRTSQQQYRCFLSALDASGNNFIALHLDGVKYARQQQQPSSSTPGIEAPQQLAVKVEHQEPAFLYPTQQLLQHSMKRNSQNQLMGIPIPAVLKQGDPTTSGHHNKGENTIISAEPEQKEQRGTTQAVTSPISLLNRIGSEHENTEMKLVEDKQFSSASFLQQSSRVYDIGLEGNGVVHGVAVIGSQVFISRHRISHIEVYDANNFTALPRHLQIRKKTWIWSRPGIMRYPELAACSQNNCLYVRHWSETESVIYRVQLSNSSVRVTDWTVKEDTLGLSVTNNCNLLVTLRSERRLQEYTTHGYLIREVTLDRSIDNPLHCIQLSDGNFVVCHPGSTQHRVCIVDASGGILKSYGGSRGWGVDQLNWPSYLSVDSSGHVFVADSDNSRVQLLSPTLSLLGQVQTPGQQLGGPSALHLDENNHRLYIGENNYRIIVVEVTQNDKK